MPTKAAFDIFKALDAVPDEIPGAATGESTPSSTAPKAPPTPAEPPTAAKTPAKPESFDIFKALDSVPNAPETSPLTPPDPTPGVTDPNEVFVGEQPVPKVIMDAAAAGVDWEAPAPTGHFLSSLAYDSENARKAYERRLSAHYGAPVSVRVGETGELEYLNPKTNRYSLVNPPGAVTPKIEALGGPAIAFGPEAFAGVTAAVISRNPHITLGAGAAGAFVGELARLQLGREMGINDNVEDSDLINSAAKSAGISLAAGQVGNLVTKWGRILIGMMSGKSLSKEAIEEIGLTMDEAMKVQSEINDRLKTHKLKFDLGQATNDQEYLQAGEYFRKTPGYRGEFKEFDDEAQAALKEFYNIINSPYRSRATTGEAMGAVQGVLKDRVGREEVRQNFLVERKAMELREAQRSIRSRPYEDLGRPLREAAGEEVEAFRMWADKAASELNAVAGNKAFVQNKETFNVVRAMDDEISNAIFPSIEKPNRALIGELGDEAAINGIKNVVFDPKAKFTFEQAWRAISALKRVERVASKGLSTDAPEVGAVRRLYSALEADLRASAQDSPLASQYNAFIERYAAEKMRLDNGAVGKMMTREGGKNGRYVIADEKVFKSFFTPGTNREAKELFAIVGDNPEQMQAVRESIIDFYKREVLDGGRVNLSRHDQWVDRYAKAARVFFDKSEMTNIMRPGAVEKALLAREAARDKALKQINSSFEGELASLNDPQRILNIIWDSKDPSKMGRLVDALTETGKTQDVLRGVQKAFLERQSNQIAGRFADEGRLLSPVRLNDYLYGKSGESGMLPVIKRLYGEQYAENLERLNKAIQIASREGVAPNRSNTSFTTQMLKGVVRFFVRPLSQESRRITAALMMKKATAEKVLFRAMMNPENLHAFMQAGDKRLGEQAVGALLGQLGGNMLLKDLSPDVEEE